MSLFNKFTFVIIILIGLSQFSQAQNAPTLLESLKAIPKISNINNSSALRSISIKNNSQERLLNEEDNQCDTYTYEQELGSNNASEIVNSLYTYTSGDVLLTGSVGDVNKTDGILIKMDKQGNRVWVKHLSNPSLSLTFSNVSADKDNAIILVGTARDINTNHYSIVICKLKSDGSIVWTKTFYTSTETDVLHAAGIVCLTEGGYAFVADNSTNIIYGILNKDGSTKWTQTLHTFDSSNTFGIVEPDEYDDLFIGINCKVNSSHFGEMLKVSKINGSILWNKRLGGGKDTAYILHSLSCVDLRPRITGIVKDKITDWQPFRLTINTSGQLENFEQYAIASVHFDSTSFICQSSQSQYIGMSPDNHSNSSIIIKDSPEGLYFWSKRFTSNALIQTTAVQKTFDGGMISASIKVNNSTDKNILVIKTDSAGILPGCDASLLEVKKIHVYNTPLYDEPKLVSLENLQENSISFSSNTSSIDSVIYCRQQYCLSLNDSNRCSPTFAKEYKNYSQCLVARNFQLTDDGIIVPGSKRDNPYDGGETGSFLNKLDAKGNMIKSIRFSEEKSGAYNTISTLDRNYITLVELFTTNQLITLYKHDKNLNAIWQKTYNIGVYNYTVRDIKEDEQGAIYIYITFKLNERTWSDKAALIKFDKEGNFLWIKTFFADNTYLWFESGGLAVVNNFIYLSTDEVSNNDTYVLKISENDGSVLWSKKIINNGSRIFLGTKILPFGNNILLHGYTLNSGIGLPSYIVMNSSGNIIHNTQITPPSGYMYSTYALCTNAGITASASTQISSLDGTLYQCNYDIDSTLKVIKATTFPNTAPPSDVHRDAYGNLFELDFENTVDPYLYSYIIRKYLPDGTLGNCSGTPTILNNQNYPFVIEDAATQLSNTIAVNAVGENLTTENYRVNTTAELCNGGSNCSFIKISGDNKVCNLQNNYTYKFKKNDGCVLHPNLHFDEEKIQLVLETDTSMIVKFLQAGSFILRATINTGCKEISDSITVVASALNDTLNLGKDTLLCNGNSILLSAGDGFVSYNWQDYSAKASYLATKEGTYYVNTIDACNQKYFDTIVVSTDQLPAIDLGIDQTKCNNDSVLITASSSFLNYHWSPLTNISNSDTNVVKLYPQTTTIYTLNAVKSNGCSTQDSLIIYVKHSPSIYLGNDTSLCSGDSLLLNPGNLFTSYLWNTGETVQSVKATEKGKYWVKATASNGCSSYDTLNILSILPLPSFTLGPDTTLCEGNQLVYDFNLPNASYQWNNGSLLSHQTITQPDNYWVAITQQGCRNYDTVTIAFQPSPIVNIGNDTMLCEGATKLLVATNTNATYQWQDNSVTSEFLVQKAGLYTVTVDINGCKSSDAALISYTPKPYFDLGKNIFLCEGSSLILTPSVNTTADYLWTNGSSNSSCLILKPGVYSLTATNRCGSFKDSILITNQICKLAMPSAFTPDKDGLNDIFKVKYPFPVKQFDMVIYNRWGQKLFETSNITKGWNGTLNNVDQDPDTYIWMISLVDSDNIKQSVHGTVTLIR